MDFQVLGPLRADDGTGEVDLGGPKQRLVLAILLAARGAAVSTDALIDGVWADAPPATARKTVQGYIHHLRSRIGAGLATNKIGYSLEVPDRRVDERRFGSDVEEARPLLASDPPCASELLTTALGLWRGNPYADLDGAPVLLPEITRLNEARLAALGDRIEADLAVGRHDLLIGELESLTIDYPFHERFRGLHMLALYRARRHGEALRAYSRARDQFIEETGLEPSAELQQLERRILDRDPALEAALEHAPGARRAIRGYELREQIENDASGTIYRGYQRSVGREVAIRVTASDVADEPYFIANFEADVARVARLEHRNILYVQDTWREPGRAYQVMTWIEGARLDRDLARGPLDDWSALRVIDQVANALTAAHGCGVVHGDVCAHNVVRSSAGDVYLTDFVVGRPQGTEADDRAGFKRLAFHTLLGIEPRTTDDLCRLTAAAVISCELRAAFETAARSDADCATLAREIRRAIAGDVVELADERIAPPRSDARCPYKGLQPFESTDAADFFGREALVDRLASLVVRRRLVAVVGPSGSGKSSLVKAGLLPRLARDDPWLLATQMYPGAYPFEALERALCAVAVVDEAIGDRLRADGRGLWGVVHELAPDDSTEILLVIDQFEEVFAAVASEAVRALFLQNLVTAVTEPESRVRIVLTMRADFFDRPLRYPALAALVESGLVPVSMPDDDGLAAAIEQPAHAVGISLQPGLVSEMVRDVADQPGGLPLLQYALTELFSSRENDVLTVDSYRESGGVLGALASRAEELYTTLGPSGQRAIQQALLRMVTVDEGADHVRRRVTRSDLAALEVDRDALDEALRRFGAHRLLTFDLDPVSRAPTVEVAHESLLREWGRLQRWIDDRRDQLVVRKRLDAAVGEWEESGEDPAFLLRSRRLNQFDGWAVDTDMALSEGERSFLQASREHDEAQTRAAVGRRRRVVSALAVTAIVAVVFGVFGLVQRERVSDRAFEAETSRLGNAAGFVVENDRQMALLMAAETYRRDPGFEGVSALQRVLVEAGPYLGNVAAGRPFSDVRWLAGDRLITVSDDELHLVDVTTGAITTLPVEQSRTPNDVEATTILATSPVGLAVVIAEGQVVLVDGEDGSTDPLMPVGDIEAAALSDDGAEIAFGRADGTLEIFDRSTRSVSADVLANPAREVDELSLPAGVVAVEDGGERLTGIRDLAFDSSGDVVVSSGGVFLRVWNVDDLTPAGPEIVHAVGRDDFNLSAVPTTRVWLDDGVVMAVTESFVSQWVASTGDRVSLDAVDAEVIDATGLEDGATLLLGTEGRVFRHTSERGSAVVFDTQEASFERLAVDADHQRLAVATDDGLVIASLDGSRLIARSVPIGASDEPTMTRDGTALAAGVVSDGLFDLTVEPPRRRAFDARVELAQSAGSPALYELISAGPIDALMWSSSFMEMRNAYDLETGEYLGGFWGPYVPAWSDDGRRLFRRAQDGGIAIDEPDGAGLLYATPVEADSADFDSTGERVVVAGGESSSPVVVELDAGDEQPLPESPGRVVAAAFTHDDERIVTVSSVGAVAVLDARTLEPMRRFEDAGSVAHRPVRPPVVDSTGRLMFSASDGVARLWHVESGRQIGRPFPGEAGGRPHGVADGEALRVVTPLDGRALIWNLDVDDWVNLACRAAGRNMTADEWATFGPRDADPRPTCPEPRS